MTLPRTGLDVTALRRLSLVDQLLAYVIWRQSGVTAATLAGVIHRAKVHGFLRPLLRNGSVTRYWDGTRYYYQPGRLPVSRAHRLLACIMTLPAPKATSRRRPHDL